MPYTFNPLSETFDFYKNPTPGGTSGQVQFNNSGVLGGVSTTAVDGSGNLTFSGRWIQSTNGASNAAPYILTGTWFSGGTGTTTKPQFLIEPAGTTSTSWSTAGTGLGVNAPSGFTGDLAWFGVNGTALARFLSNGRVGLGTNSPDNALDVVRGTAGAMARGFYESASFSYDGDTKLGIYCSASAGAGASAALVFGATNFTASSAYPGFEMQFFPSTTLASNKMRFNSIQRSITGQVTSFVADIFTLFQAGNVCVGTSTNSGFLFDVNGTARFSGNVTVSAVNLVTDTTTGTKIGTATNQKLGFYNATPVAQPAAVADATDAASVITQLNLLLARMRSLGLIAT